MIPRLLVAVAIAGMSLIWISGVMRKPMQTVLPNGFVLQENTVVLSRDRSTILSSDAELICFDDRFLLVISMKSGESLLFDSQSQGQSDKHNQSALYALGGLLYGPNSCNGYYTGMMGPGLLHDGGRWPFLPSCESVNSDNPNLRDRDWLNRPCAAR